MRRPSSPGRLTACVGTAGPGAIHLLNGLYDAKLDHAPVIAVTGQIESDLVGTDHHQEVDLYTLFKDVAVFNHVIMTPGQMPHIAVHACQAAVAHQGVAHLSLPVDVASQPVPDPDRRHAMFMGDALIAPCDDDLDRSAEILNSADKVAILVGIGAQHARSELIDIAELLGAPVVKTLRAKEILPDEHPLVVGGLGLLGTKPAVKAVEECDALLMIGTDFPYHDFYPNNVPAVQIDIDPMRLGKRYPITVGLRGHARLALPALASRMTRKDDRSFLADRQQEMRAWLEEMDEVERSEGSPIHPQTVARSIGDFLTAVKYDLPITIVVFNNRKLGLIQMEQEVKGYPEYQTALQDLDFGAFARLAGGDGVRVTAPGDLDDALRTAFASNKPYVVDVEINPEERTMPPKILPGQVLGYGIAKTKEFFGKGDKEGGPSVITDALQ